MSASSSPNDLPQEIVQLANNAVHFDREGNLDVAIYYYEEAAKSLADAKSLAIPFPNLDVQFAAYRERAEKLKEQCKGYCFLFWSWESDLNFFK